MSRSVNIMWFRRDLRLHDNTALYHSLKDNNPVVPIFIFDKNILNQLEDRQDKRVTFIYHTLLQIQQQLVAIGSTLEIYYDYPIEVFKYLSAKYKIEKVLANHDYEPYARERDQNIKDLLNSTAAIFLTFKDQVILEKDEVLKDDGKPYTVFTPYSRRWKNIVENINIQSYPTEKYFNNFYKQTAFEIPTLASMRFNPQHYIYSLKTVQAEVIKKYSEYRDIPSADATSKLSVHLRFGTISIRELTKQAISLSEPFLNELIWRDFYHMILWHFPKVGLGKAFKSEYENIIWRNNEKEFTLWCEGKTGYPIVDAGMKQLNTTGFMHNRLRMITASFLIKHLLIDWRWGEAYFAQKLLDFDLAANNGGWQWAAGSGCDAVPYFRIFNPILQTKKFDPEFKYIRSWVPEFEEIDYPEPVVQHDFARKRALDVFSKALKT